MKKIFLLLILSYLLYSSPIPQALGSLVSPGTGSTDTATAGWTDDGTIVRLNTSSDSVGIGTVNPGNKLEVIGGNIYASGDLFAAGADLTLGTGSASSTLTVIAPGFLGIGSTSPAAFLGIQGNTFIAGTTTVKGIYATSTIETSFFRVTGSATSTFVGNGVDLGVGCFSIRGTCLPLASNVITSLNGLTGSTQTFAVQNTSSDWNVLSIGSSGTTHTFTTSASTSPAFGFFNATSTTATSIISGKLSVPGISTIGQLFVGTTTDGNVIIPTMLVEASSTALTGLEVFGNSGLSGTIFGIATSSKGYSNWGEVFFVNPDGSANWLAGDGGGALRVLVGGSEGDILMTAGTGINNGGTRAGNITLDTTAGGKVKIITVGNNAILNTGTLNADRNFAFPNWSGEFAVSTSTLQVSALNATSTTIASTFMGGVFSRASTTIQGTFAVGSSLTVGGTIKWGNVTYTAPTADGTSGQVLSTNGSGVLSFITAGGSFATTSGDWILMGRFVTKVATATIAVDNIPQKEYLKFVFMTPGQTAAATGAFSFNSDDGANYDARCFANFADNGQTNRTDGFLFNKASPKAGAGLMTIEVANIATGTKAVNYFGTWAFTSGGTQPDGETCNGNWNNTTAGAVNRIRIWSRDETKFFLASTTLEIWGSRF